MTVKNNAIACLPHRAPVARDETRSGGSARDRHSWFRQSSWRRGALSCRIQECWQVSGGRVLVGRYCQWRWRGRQPQTLSQVTLWLLAEDSLVLARRQWTGDNRYAPMIAPSPERKRP